MLFFIDNPLHKHADGRRIIVNDVTRTKAIRAYENPLVQTGTEKIDRHEGRADIRIAIAELLAEQQLFAAQRAVAVGGNGIAYDATDEHDRVRLLDDMKVIHEHAAAHAGEGFGSGDAFASGGGDGVGKVALATESETSGAGSVFHEDGSVHFLCHRRHVVDVAGVDHRGVAVVVLGLFGVFHGRGEVGASDDGNHRHHLLFLHEGVIGTGFTEKDGRAAGNIRSGMAGKHGRIGADELAIDGGV